MGQRPEACHDVRQYEVKGRHYPMKLLPESSNKKTERAESVLWEWNTVLHWPTQGQRNRDPPLGSFLPLNPIPQFPLYHLMLSLT